YRCSAFLNAMLSGQKGLAVTLNEEKTLKLKATFHVWLKASEVFYRILSSMAWQPCSLKLEGSFGQTLRRFAMEALPSMSADPTLMSAEELRAEIEATRRHAQAEEARFDQILAENEQAKERQRLREELREARDRLQYTWERNDSAMVDRRAIDDDELRVAPQYQPVCPFKKPPVMQANGGGITNFGDMVAKGTYIWRIEGFSWVPCAVEQIRLEGFTPPFVTFVHSHPDFNFGNQEFQFRYSPWAHYLCDQHHGSLAIVPRTRDGVVVLRYRIFVKAQSGEFVQWGRTRDVVHDGDSGRTCAYGPDVHWPDDPPASLGIFGLSHEELLESQWVENDTLTVKFELEVRPPRNVIQQPLSLATEIPEPTIHQDTQALLEEGICSDVRFMVQDEVIQAHSQVLCARSEVFRNQLTAGMQESISKVIKIEDCDVTTFKAFLQFVYTDRLPNLQELLSMQTSSESRNQNGAPQPSQIQALLAVSHKYQVKRLQLWCEAKLSEQIDTAQVCGMLCQAHLFQAKQLEQACLCFIRDHADQVFTLPAYLELITKWPEIALKINLFSAGVSEAEALAAMDALEKQQGQQSEQAAA
ncbi:BPM3, partial [Symbiodinium sp. CCMP2456]